jgi:hypothetical protein
LTPDPACVKMLAGKVVYVVGDCDTAGQAGAERWCDALAGVAREVRNVVLPYPATDDHGKDVRDYLNDGRTYEDLLGLAAAASPRPDASGKKGVLGGERGDNVAIGGPPPDDGAGPAPPCRRPKIVVTTEEYVVNAQAAAALAADTSLYQRGGMLVRVRPDAKSGAPMIQPLPPELLRESFTRVAEWVVRSTNKKTGEVTEIDVHPPEWSVNAVLAIGEWPGLRRLEGVVDHPVLRPDGTVLCQAGYDDATGLLLEWTAEPLAVPDTPTWKEAGRACDRLLRVVEDFPFGGMTHQAAWLAALMTPLARFAFDGPPPLFLCDGNVRGSGKGLLLDCIAIILTGKPFFPSAYPHDEAELRKRITAIALGGGRLVLFDNITGHFGDAVLDAALTGTSWEDRLLTTNKQVKLPLSVTWFATGNNVDVMADTGRRTCLIRLESDREKPEERDDFRHSPLRAYVRRHRIELLTAALTILRAYHVVGRPVPRRRLRSWGSFEGWSALVRNAVVWLGMPDPYETCVELQKRADTTASDLGALFAALEWVDEDGEGVTALDIMDAADGFGERAAGLRSVLEALIGKGNSRQLGYLLRSHRRRVIGGRFVDSKGVEHGATRWAVYPESDFHGRARRAGGGAVSPLPPAVSPPPAGFLWSESV